VRVRHSEDSKTGVPKQLALVVSATLLSVTAAALSSVGALAQFPAAGSYSTATTTAFFQTDPNNFSQSVSAQVDEENDISMPQGGPRTAAASVQVSYSFSFFDGVNYIFGNGCVVVPGSDFTVDSKLQTASLNAAITSTTPTCGFPENGPVPSNISVTWTASSPVVSLTGDRRFACAGYTNEIRSINSSDSASGTATLEGTLPGSFPAFQAFLRSQTIQTFAQGAVPPDTCAQFIGRGAFGGFPAAGNYHQSVIEGDANLFPTDPSTPLVFVNLKRIASTSSPIGGTPSSVDETDLNLFVQSDTLSGSGCFVIDPTNFTVSSDLTSAQLDTQLTAGTAVCGSNNSMPLPLNVDVTWSGPGPISTIGDDLHIACQQYHSLTSSSQTINGSPAASITLTIPGTPATTLGPFPAQGALGSSDSRTQAAGVIGSGCSLH
jgi:hypothetical protein